MTATGTALCDRISALRSASSLPGPGRPRRAIRSRQVHPGARRSGPSAAGALVIDGDDFYRGGDDAYWDALDPAEKVELVIDWRAPARPARATPPWRARATWRPYDWDADDGRLGAAITAGPADVVLLDGAYSARPELADLFGLRVLLDVARATPAGPAPAAGGRARPGGVGGPLG